MNAPDESLFLVTTQDTKSARGFRAYLFLHFTPLGKKNVTDNVPMSVMSRTLTINSIYLKCPLPVVTRHKDHTVWYISMGQQNHLQ